MSEPITKSILIIEDEEALRKALQLKLEAKGYQVLTAKDGEEGLQKILDSRPSLVLLDIMMPHVDGFSMLQMVRDKEEIKNTKVILLTNLGQEEDEQKGKELGAVDYLVKANTPLDQIIEVINKHI